MLGYNIITNDLERDNRGIVVYIRSDIRFTEVNIENEFEELCMIKIVLEAKGEIYFGIIYRSPNSTSENNARLFKFIRDVSIEKEKVVLIGDFNFPNIRWDTWTTTSGREEKEFLEVLRDSYMNQYVLEPTRYRASNCPHILDLVLSNSDIIKDVEFLSPLGKSDHSVLLVKVYGKVLETKNDLKLNYKKVTMRK